MKKLYAVPAIGLLLTVPLVIHPPVAHGDEKVIQRDDTPPNYERFRVAPDGSRIYMSGQNGKYLVFDANGKLLDQFGVSNSGQPKDLVPLPDGKFIGITSYFSAHIAIVRPDGTEEKTIITKGSNENLLHGDQTGVTSPQGGAVDVVRKKIFANEDQKRWQTAQRGLFLKGAVNTYTLNLKGVTKWRYVPWSSYYRNFYTSEIEVR